MNSYEQPTENSPNLNIENKPQDVVCPICNKLTPYEERCRFCGATFLPPLSSAVMPNIQQTPQGQYSLPHYSFTGYSPQQSGYYPPQFGYPQQNFNPYPQQNYFPPKKTGYGWIIALLCSILVALIVSSIIIVKKLEVIIEDLYYSSYENNYDYGYDNYYEDENDPYGGLFDFGVPEDESGSLPENDTNKPGEIVFNNIGVFTYEPKLTKVEKQGSYLVYTIILTNLGEEIISITPENFTLKIGENEVKPTSEMDNELDVKSMKNTAIAVGEEIRTKLVFKIDEDTVSADIYIQDEDKTMKILTSKFS